MRRKCKRGRKCKLNSDKCVVSSVGQSNRLLIYGSWFRVPYGAPNTLLAQWIEQSSSKAQVGSSTLSRRANMSGYSSGLRGGAATSVGTKVCVGSNPTPLSIEN